MTNRVTDARIISLEDKEKTYPSLGLVGKSHKVWFLKMYFQMEAAWVPESSLRVYMATDLSLTSHEQEMTLCCVKSVRFWGFATTA